MDGLKQGWIDDIIDIGKRIVEWNIKRLKIDVYIYHKVQSCN